jgi:hypothetical protein
LPAVGLDPSSQLAADGCLGASIVEPSVPERVLDESPLLDGEVELSMSPASEAYLGASDVGRLAGDGPSSRAEPISPVRSLAVAVASPLGKDLKGSLGASADGRPAEEGSSSGTVLSKDPEPKRDLGGDSGSADEGFSVPKPPLHAVGELVSTTPVNIPVSSSTTPLITEADLEPPFRSPSGQNTVSWPASSTGLDYGSAAPAGSGSATPVSSPAIPSSPKFLLGSASHLGLVQGLDPGMLLGEGENNGSAGEPPAVGLELSLVPVDASFIGPSAVEGYASMAELTPLAVIPSEESDVTLTVVAPPDAGDGSPQLTGPGFSVPSAEEFLDFLPTGSLSKDWQDFFSSLHTDRRGMSDSKLIKEAFALPWEVDEPASPSCRDKEASSCPDEKLD